MDAFLNSVCISRARTPCEPRREENARRTHLISRRSAHSRLFFANHSQHYERILIVRRQGNTSFFSILLLVSLTLESLLKAFSHYVQSVLPGGLMVAMSVSLIFDFAVIILLFAMIFKFLPDAEIQWRNVWIGAVITAILFGIGKWLLGLYLGSGAAGSTYGPASSLITLLLWVYYASQILLFGAEFTQVYADQSGREVKPDQYAVRIEREEVESR